MNYGEIKNYDIANGRGVRVSLFVSGCRNHCEGCFQPQTWDFAYGKPYTEKIQEEILDMISPEYIEGLTVLGGEPFEEENQPYVADLMREVKERFPEKDIWCYTGYRMEQDLVPGGRKYTEYTDEMLKRIDVLVDGPFLLDQKDISLTFRGSRNQRLLKLKDGKIQEVLSDTRKEL